MSLQKKKKEKKREKKRQLVRFFMEDLHLQVNILQFTLKLFNLRT